MIDLSLAVAVVAAFSVLFFVIGMEVHRHTAEKSALEKLIAQYEQMLNPDALAAHIASHCAETINAGLEARLPTEERFRESVEALIGLVRAADAKRKATRKTRRAA